MKRVVLICIAALLVLLTYPSTYSLAKESDLSDSSAIVSGADLDGGVSLSGSGDDGDADDLAGARRKTRTRMEDVDLAASSGSIFRTFLQVWWNFMVIIR